jgi:hypothetical protein
VLLLDPMLGEFAGFSRAPDAETVKKATGGSAVKAVEVLKEHGVPEDRIVFINLVTSQTFLAA